MNPYDDIGIGVVDGPTGPVLAVSLGLLAIGRLRHRVRRQHRKPRSDSTYGA